MKLVVHSELNEQVGDLALPKESAKCVGSILKETNLLAGRTSLFLQEQKKGMRFLFFTRRFYDSTRLITKFGIECKIK